MNLFGIGTSEFVIIFILALIFLGPQRLPEYANKLGQKIREWRMMSQVFMVEWKEELAALEEARLSLAEARSALLDAQATISSEVKEVTETVSSEMKSAQKDISAQLSDAGKAVSAETAQVRDTMEKAKKGQIDTDTAKAREETTDPSTTTTDSPETTGDVADTKVADGEISVVGGADVDDVSDISDIDISDVEEIDEDETSVVVENTIAPPVATKQTQTIRPTELDEIDVAEVQTVSDVASVVAEKIATEVATQVARKVAKNMTSNMAEEVAALVMAKLAEAGINSIVTNTEELPQNAVDAGETFESISTESESPEYHEVVNE